MRQLIHVLVTLVLFSAFSAHGDERENEAVREYLRMSQAVAQFRAGMRQAIADNPSKPLPPLAQRILALKDSDIEEVMIPIYVEAWGKENCNPILLFMNSEAGKEIVAKSIQASNRSKVTFSSQTLYALQKFVETPAGKAWSQSLPVIQQKLWPAIQRHASIQ